MKAWIFEEAGEPLSLREVDDPTPGPGEAVVDLRAAGLCHSDVGFMDGTMTGVLGFMPIILGHEAAGVVSAVGDGVTDFSVGDRVAVAAMGDGKSGVIGQKNIGVGRHGAFAEKTLSPVSELIPISDTTSFDQAAAATDAGMTAYHALFIRGGLRPGMKVGIIGLGGLGMTGARLAVIGGARVWAAEINEAVHAEGLQRGVERVVKETKDLSELEPELIVDFAGFGTTTAAAIEAVAPGGNVVQIGMGVSEATINTHSVTLKQIGLLGSLGGTPQDAKAVLDFIGSGQLTIASKVISFDQIPEGLKILERGEAGGRRLVAMFGG